MFIQVEHFCIFIQTKSWHLKLLRFLHENKVLEVEHSKLAYNPSTGEVEAGRSGVQDQPQPHSEFKASLAYMRPCLKTNKKTSSSSVL